MNGFWEIIRNKGVFRGYTRPEVRRLIGGVSEIDWYVSDLFSETKKSYLSFFFAREQHSERLTGNEEDERIGFFWRVLKSWPLEYREALLRYITGFKRVPATDKFKILRTPRDSDCFSHFSVLGVQERALQREDEATLVHVLLVPNFGTCEELEEKLLHTICNSVPVRGHLNHFYSQSKGFFFLTPSGTDFFRRLCRIRLWIICDEGKAGQEDLY